MLSANLAEYFACRTGTAARHIIQTLANGLEDVGACGNVEQLLIGFRVLDYGFRLPVERKDNRPLALLEMTEEFTGFAAERGKGLDVLGDIESNSNAPRADC
jgi:hypothetical protein